MYSILSWQILSHRTLYHYLAFTIIVLLFLYSLCVYPLMIIWVFKKYFYCCLCLFFNFLFFGFTMICQSVFLCLLRLPGFFNLWKKNVMKSKKFYHWLQILSFIYSFSLLFLSLCVYIFDLVVNFMKYCLYIFHSILSMYLFIFYSSLFTYHIYSELPFFELWNISLYHNPVTKSLHLYNLVFKLSIFLKILRHNLPMVRLIFLFTIMWSFKNAYKHPQLSRGKQLHHSKKLSCLFVDTPLQFHHLETIWMKLQVSFID